MTDSTEPRDPAEIFLSYKELAEIYWELVAARRYPTMSTPREAEWREKLALMLPVVEQEADRLDISYMFEGRAPPVVGGFSVHVNMLKAVYDRDDFGPEIANVRDFLNECVSRARLGISLQKRSLARGGTKVVIGHGGSTLWLQLKEFVKERCQLEPDEYNLVATAGFSRKERLQQMLDTAAFALLVMTAEDEQPDGTTRARENVVHEVGLFQGRLGFTRAIVLLEDGCSEFSNIAGLDQIRFPKGDIEARFERVRRLLERERLLRPPKP